MFGKARGAYRYVEGREGYSRKEIVIVRFDAESKEMSIMYNVSKGFFNDRFRWKPLD